MFPCDKLELVVQGNINSYSIQNHSSCPLGLESVINIYVYTYCYYDLIARTAIGSL